MRARGLLLSALAAAVMLGACGEAKNEKVINELGSPTSTLRRQLHKAEEHGATSPSDAARLAQEEAEAEHMTPAEAARVLEREAKKR